MTDWNPGDPLYPAQIPWVSPVHPSSSEGHRDGGQCWCEQHDDTAKRAFAGASRYTPEFPPPRFYPVPTLTELQRRLPLLVEPEETA